MPEEDPTLWDLRVGRFKYLKFHSEDDQFLVGMIQLGKGDTRYVVSRDFTERMESFSRDYMMVSYLYAVQGILFMIEPGTAYVGTSRNVKQGGNV